MRRSLQALAIVLLLTILSMRDSPTKGLDSDENWVMESIEPPTDLITQGENFTLKVEAFIDESKVYAVGIWASVVYPFMEILEANYTLIGATMIGPIDSTPLNFTRDSLNFSAYVFQPANITVNATVFCSIAGSFYLPTASLSVGIGGRWTEYRSNRVGPLTIVSRVEAFKLEELQVEVAALKEALHQLADELEAARAELRDLKAQGADLRESIGVVNGSVNRVEAAISTLNVKVDAIDAELEVVRGCVEAIRSKLETEVTWALLAALGLITLTCVGAWLSAAYARKRTRLSP